MGDYNVMNCTNYRQPVACKHDSVFPYTLWIQWPRSRHFEVGMYLPYLEIIDHCITAFSTNTHPPNRIQGRTMLSPTLWIQWP